jgi:proline dehydrogenase
MGPWRSLRSASPRRSTTRSSRDDRRANDADWLQELRAQHFSVRVYLPFGTDWGPYALRRVGENPRNVLMLGRALFGSKYRAQAAMSGEPCTRS